jgi:orotate phosphoribosyltransferase-like protein
MGRPSIFNEAEQTTLRKLRDKGFTYTRLADLFGLANEMSAWWVCNREKQRSRDALKKKERTIRRLSIYQRVKELEQENVELKTQINELTSTKVL